MSYIRNKWEDLGTEIVSKSNEHYELYHATRTSFPKVINSGVASHGYGGDNGGKTSADKLNMLTETIASLVTDITERAYVGWSNDIINGYGYAHGGNSGTTTNSTKMKLSDGSCSEVSQSLIKNGSTGGIMIDTMGIIKTDEGEKMIKHNYSDDTFSDTGLSAEGDWNATLFSDWSNKIGYHLDTNNNVKRKIKITNMTQSSFNYTGWQNNGYNGRWLSFREKTLLVPGHGSTANERRLESFRFSNDTSSLLSSLALRASSELTTFSGHAAYNVGGYDSGGARQNAYGYVFSYDVGLLRSLPNATKPRSSGAGYV